MKMSKPLALLALCLALAGCGDKQEANRDGSKQADSAPSRIQQQQQTAMKRAASGPIQADKQELVLLLNRAEHVFAELYYAAASMPGGKTQRDDGLLYRQLPPRFSSREKVIAHFSRYWSRPLAVQMYDNLDTKIIDGKLYLRIPDEDYPVLISQANTTISADLNGVTAIVRNAAPANPPGRQTVTYRLARDQRSGRLEIVKREGAYGSKMFR
ncbi:hypothetical protein [Brevibacillus marinus]|uniref:hypothetical protein n=1 Tax=Brevibacillus marinus TaxID=2496837 RepID=UPI000F83F33F|nr:hypothetical protein [Brevibacillus marinus]